MSINRKMKNAELKSTAAAQIHCQPQTLQACLPYGAVGRKYEVVAGACSAHTERTYVQDDYTTQTTQLLHKYRARSLPTGTAPGISGSGGFDVLMVAVDCVPARAVAVAFARMRELNSTNAAD